MTLRGLANTLLADETRFWRGTGGGRRYVEHRAWTGWRVWDGRPHPRP